MQDLSSLTREQTQAPCIGSVESQPLDHQASPYFHNLNENGNCSSILSAPLSVLHFPELLLCTHPQEMC